MGKFTAVSPEDYIKMGQNHTQGSRQITPEDAACIQKQLNGHVSCWLMMTGMGESRGHQPRMREALLQDSNQVPPMKLLVKDHKPVGADGLPATRPVVSANSGMNVALSNILSDILEPTSRTIRESTEVVSTEQTLNLINTLNDQWSSEAG